MIILNRLEPQLPVMAPPQAASNSLETLVRHRLCELFELLESVKSPPIVLGEFSNNEILLSRKPVCVKVWLDWMDYGPLSSGLPTTHFRIVVKGEHHSHELRIRSTEEAAAAIVTALNAGPRQR